MRLKAALIIIAITFAITAANLAATLILTRRSLSGTMGKDITLAVEIANDLVSTRIMLYESNAETIAERLMRAGDTAEMTALMQEQLGDYKEFIALAVFDRQGAVAECGDSPASADWLSGSVYMQLAFEGRTVISTTIRNEDTEKLVIHIFTPMGRDRILSATINGMVFSELLEDYILWNKGHIFMLDDESTIIAYYDTEPVLARASFASVLSPSDPQSAPGFPDGTLLNDRWQGNYNSNGVEYQCAYARVSAPGGVNWYIGLTIPLRESPLTQVQNRLTVLSVLFFAVGVAVAVVSSGYIAKPYNMIAEQKRHLEELNEIALSQAGEIAEASMAKSSFLASMSHEMRTPLNAVVGLSELLLNSEEVFGEVEDRLSVIYNSGMTMLGIVNDILDISKIESGKFDLNLTEYDTPSLINDVISLNTVRIGEKPIKFILTLDESLPAKLYGDDLRVKQIFNNLLSNAFKYTNSGTVEWSVSYMQSGDDLWLESGVRDTGIGIKSEDIPKLFQDYSQVDAKMNRDTEGTGLGLSITKRLATMMDGSVSVESEYGKGTVFSVRLRQQALSGDPIGRETAQNLMSDRFSSSRRANRANMLRIDLSYARVLIVDDMPANLDIAKGMLALYGIHVDTVTNGRSAIEMIRAEEPRYDAVFMDHMMPGMDGIEAVRIIREDIGTDYARDVPVIALTANASAGNEKVFLNNDFQAFISKPIDMIWLDNILRKWVRDKERETERDIERGYCVIDGHVAFSEDGPLPLDGVTIDGVDVVAGMERFGNCEDAYIKVLRSYSVNTRDLLTSLKELLDAENLVDFTIALHGIKGSSYGVGAVWAGTCAERLERLADEEKTEQVSAEYSVYVKYMEILLDSIDDALELYDSTNKKPALPEPDPSLLQELREACGDYDAGRVDRLMEQLEAYEYDNGAGLVAWLRGQVDDMNYDEIAGGNWTGAE